MRIAEWFRLPRLANAMSQCLHCSTTRETPPRMPGVMKTLRRPEGHSAIRIPRFLANLAFEYPDQLLNRGRQTKLLARCTQTGSAQVLSLFRVQEQSSDG